MAAKDHTLDEKIINSANVEFLARGFTKASLRRISDSAGITTGALYTRYKNKDELFCKLVSDICNRIDEHFSSLVPLYYEAVAEKSFEKYSQAVQFETTCILELIYSNYDACFLLLCCSEGSSVENWFKKMIQRIISVAQEFYGSVLEDNITNKALELIITAQFSVYGQIIRDRYSKEEAETCLKLVSTFFDSGWKMMMAYTLK